MEDAPVAEKVPESRAVEPDNDSCRMATLGDRFLAFVLDSMVLFGLFIVVDAWVFMRWGVVEGWEHHTMDEALAALRERESARADPA